MNAIMRILRYLMASPEKGILFSKNTVDQNINVYIDVDGVGAVNDRRSISEYITLWVVILLHGETRNRMFLRA